MLVDMRGGVGGNNVHIYLVRTGTRITSWVWFRAPNIEPQSLTCVPVGCTRLRLFPLVPWGERPTITTSHGQEWANATGYTSWDNRNILAISYKVRATLYIRSPCDSMTKPGSLSHSTSTDGYIQKTKRKRGMGVAWRGI